jgi:autotransporter-associated beta strand protein
MTKKHYPPQLIKTGPAFLIAAFLVLSPALADDYYNSGDEGGFIGDPKHYSNADGKAEVATKAPGPGDDLFFYNSSVKGPADRTLQVGAASKGYHSMTFRSNAGQTQINRLTEEKSLTGTIVYIGPGGITVEAGAGPVSFGGFKQRVSIGVKSDFTVTNNSSSDLTFHREVRGYTNNTYHTITVAGSGNTIFKEIWDNSNGRSLAMSVNTSGNGVVRFDGKNTYKGPTTVVAGKLIINGNATAADGEVEVSPAATFGGSGELGGSVSIADNGRLEFEISTRPEEHNAMDLADPRKLTFAGASVLTITSPVSASVGKYTLINAPGGISGAAPATLNLPAGWKASVSIEGNNLVLDLTSVGTR